MKRIRLDGKKMTSRSQAHEYIMKKLNFPEYYGKNLDALADCLSEISDETEIRITNEDKLIENLGNQYKGFIRVFSDIAESNPNLRFKCNIKEEEQS